MLPDFAATDFVGKQIPSTAKHPKLKTKLESLSKTCILQGDVLHNTADDSVFGHSHADSTLVSSKATIISSNYSVLSSLWVTPGSWWPPSSSRTENDLRAGNVLLFISERIYGYSRVLRSS